MKTVQVLPPQDGAQMAGTYLPGVGREDGARGETVVRRRVWLLSIETGYE